MKEKGKKQKRTKNNKDGRKKIKKGNIKTKK